MPLPIETQIETPNAVYASNIVLSSRIVGGQLRVSANITLAGAINTDGTWVKATGQHASIRIPDIMNLPADLVTLAPQVAPLFDGLVAIIGAINSIRKAI
ncbi:MAG: hypothetical protein A2Y12_00125 [Planctomycetes bacterium GWF2_42_9]|nr:MAG: hypothetical protein A2Y12_00125 [Planctomycetes bacterium GWF2_42_9]